MKISTITERALYLIQENEIYTPRQFGHLMWPDSPKWNNAIKTGSNGTHRGRGMYKAAGCYLAKLKKHGLVKLDFDNRFILTTKSKDILISNAIE